MAVAITNKRQTLQQFKVDNSQGSDSVYKFDPFSRKILSRVKGLKRILIKNASL